MFSMATLVSAMDLSLSEFRAGVATGAGVVLLATLMDARIGFCTGSVCRGREYPKRATRAAAIANGTEATTRTLFRFHWLSERSRSFEIRFDEGRGIGVGPVVASRPCR